MQWYYIDLDSTQHGPINSKLLVHKIKEGDIDSLTLIYGGNCLEWKKLGDIDILNKEIIKIANEEENARLAFKETSRIEQEQQMFVGGYELDAKTLSDLESLQQSSQNSK